MNIRQDLSENNLKVILTCMRIISEGDELEGEYQTRLGVDEQTLRNVITAFPHLMELELNDIYLQAAYGISQLDIYLAFNNCMNEVCHGIYMSDVILVTRYGISREETSKVFEEFRTRITYDDATDALVMNYSNSANKGDESEPGKGRRYFNGMV